MPGPFEAAGALKGPTKFAALTMGGRQMTGMVTQKSPYRDGMVPYLVAKFYGGSRTDTIWDGQNREINQKLCDQRAPGSTVWNSNDFDPIASFYSWSYIQDGQLKFRTFVDCPTTGAQGEVIDASNNGKAGMIAKSFGAGPARFLGVNTELFVCDGVDTQKVIAGNRSWTATTSYNPGDLINTGGEPSDLQMALGGITLPIVATSSDGTFVTIYVNQQNVPLKFPNLDGVAVTFSGLATATYLNGNTYPVDNVLSTTLGIFTIALVHTPYAYQTEATGQGSTGNGVSGGTAPAFSSAPFAVVVDAGQQWKCYGLDVQNWGLALPLTTLTVTEVSSDTRFWRPLFLTPTDHSILDLQGNIQFTGAGGTSGFNYPNFASTEGATTTDGTVLWVCLGPAGAWMASTAFGLPTDVAVILDSNGNLQYASTPGTSDVTEPTWATAIGATTTDNTVTWTCLGAGYVLYTNTTQWAFSTHAIDGSVSTASTRYTIFGGVLGPVNYPPMPVFNQLASFVPDPQIDAIWTWRTPQGQNMLVLEDQFPVDTFAAGTFTAPDYGIPDTSTNGNGALNPFIAAPVASANNPPPANITALTYFQQRTWGIVDNTVVYSGGPDVLVGNGNTAFPPLNSIPFAAQPIRLIPVLVQNGGMIVMTTNGIRIILGTGTSSNPYYVGDYLELVSIANYNAVSVFYNQIFCMESNGKVSSIAIEYPFNPQTGYTEVGFPIGDQFEFTNTGGVDAEIFDPATSYVSWNAASSSDTGMYVSDGAGHWFRLSLINPPESGMLWSPLRTIAVGASAVQNVQVAAGRSGNLLLMGPASSGPILQRDRTGTVFTDDGVEYPSWDAKGVTLLCTTGEWARLKHVNAKSKNTGGPRPTVSVLFNEIAPSAERPYIELTLNDGKGQDPPRNPPSVSVYSDRYRLAQQGREVTGDCVLIKFDYGTNAFGDELLDWGILGGVEDENQEQTEAAAPGRA